MKSFLSGPGFLGTNATFRSDLTLILILITAALFTIGWWLAAHKRYAAHRKLQTFAVILNSAVVLLVMVSSFYVYILPGIPAKLGEGSYGLTTVHAILGLAGMLLGIFVVLRGHNRVPKRWRFKNYKLFMRATYILYMLATLSGVIVYVVVYVFGI